MKIKGTLNNENIERYEQLKIQQKANAGVNKCKKKQQQQQIKHIRTNTDKKIQQNKHKNNK